MKKSTLQHRVLAAVAAFGLASWSSTMAEEMVVGLNRVTCLPKSDTHVSVPFMKAPLKATGTLASQPVTSGDEATLTPAESTAWTPGELAGNYYVRFTSGALAGHWYDILRNDSSSVSIDLNGESADGLAKGDGFVIVEYWTLNTLFPPDSQSTIHLSEGTLVYQQNSKILFPDPTGIGINRAAAGIYFLTDEGWKQSSPGYPDAGDKILPPGLPFIIRHPQGVGATEFVSIGEVLRSADAIWLAQSSDGPQDNQVALFRPLDVELADSGLDDSTFVPSVSHEERKDELLVFDNAAEGFNKKASTIYYKLADGWYREDAASSTEEPSGMLEASGGMIIRKAKGTDLSTIWNNEPNY